MTRTFRCCHARIVRHIRRDRHLKLLSASLRLKAAQCIPMIVLNAFRQFRLATLPITIGKKVIEAL